MRFAAFLLLFSITTSAFAQNRSVDIAIKLVTPANGSVITPGMPFNFTIQAKNVAGQALQPSDTIKVRFLYDGAVFTFLAPDNTIDTFLRLGGNTIGLGDSMIVFSQQIGLNDSGAHSLCFESFLVAASSTSGIVDPNPVNDRSCSQVNLTTVGINSVTRKDIEFEVYPIPTHDVLRWRSGDNFQPSIITLYGLNGACVQKISVSSTNTVMDVSTLPHGIYQFIAIDESGVTVSRRIVLE